VELRIYDVSGRHVRTLVDRSLDPGEHYSFWDGRWDSGREAATGIYLYRLIANGEELTRKMILLR